MSGVIDVQSLLAKSKKEKLERRSLIRLHHELMKEYGWIPFDEFLNMPLPTLFDLVEEIKMDREEQHRQMEKNKRKR